MQHTLITAAFLVIALQWTAQAQPQLSLPQTDQQTYELFRKQEWKALAEAGRQALREQTDFYYLRVRMGIAYYQMGNYHIAIRHLSAAAPDPSEAEPYVLEYLYYACLFAGRAQEARLLGQSFPAELKSRLGIRRAQPLQMVEAGYHYGTSPQNQSTTYGPPRQEGYQLFHRWHHYFFAGAAHTFSPRLSAYQAYSGLRTGHQLYLQTDGLGLAAPDYRATLHQYYASLTWQAKRGLFLTGGGHLLYTRFPVLEVSTPGPRRTPQRYDSQNAWLAFASVRYSLPMATIGATVYYGTLANATQYQQDVRLTLFPGGNLNFYTHTVVSLQQQVFSSAYQTNRAVLTQEVGGRIAPKLWAELYGNLGQMENFFLADGLVVLNRADVVRGRGGLRWIFVPESRWKCTLDFSALAARSQFLEQPLQPTLVNPVNYLSHGATLLVSHTF